MDRQQERLIEWACQKVMRNYYKYVDQYKYEDAAALFTEDATWKVMGVDLEGRDQILKGLYEGLQTGTIRHVLTNTVVTVIDENLRKHGPTTTSIIRRARVRTRLKAHCRSMAQTGYPITMLHSHAQTTVGR